LKGGPKSGIGNSSKRRLTKKQQDSVILLLMHLRLAFRYLKNVWEMISFFEPKTIFCPCLAEAVPRVAVVAG
jgi:hypothetical protein